MFLDCCSTFFLFYLYYVYCYAPKYYGKVLVCVDLLGNKPDSNVMFLVGMCSFFSFFPAFYFLSFHIIPLQITL